MGYGAWCIRCGDLGAHPWPKAYVGRGVWEGDLLRTGNQHYRTWEVPCELSIFFYL